MRKLLLFIKSFLRFVLKPLSFLPALIVMYIIFQFSSQNGITSSELSYKVAKKIITIANEQFDQHWSDQEVTGKIEEIHYYVRKGAHVTEYFILSICVAFPLYVYGIRGIWLVILATMYCVGFAGLDEYHQSFVAGRGPSIRDVCIDSIGIIPGIYIMRIIGFIGRKTIFRPLSRK